MRRNSYLAIRNRYERENRLEREADRIVWRFEAYVGAGGDKDLRAGDFTVMNAFYRGLIERRRQGLRERAFDRLTAALQNIARRHDPRRQKEQRPRGPGLIREAVNVVSPQEVADWRSRMRLDGRGEHYRFRF